jgi:hemerythrin-like domain-containing protein
MYLARSAIGGLMHEHQLILRVVADMGHELERLEAGGEVDPGYIETTVDFIRTYADRCHHGKEEDILFRDLATKELSAEDAEAMRVLIEDHVWARGQVRELVEATEHAVAGDASASAVVRDRLRALAEFYPDHIEREDHGFFRAVPGYFTRDELDAMAAECADFERSLIHERYLRVAEALEARHEEMSREASHA